MGKLLHAIVFAVLTWNCVANSYTIRNKYRRMPVDRSSQGVEQVMLERNAKVAPSKSAKSRQTSEPAGIPLPTLSTAAKNAVIGVRNDLSNLGGTLIGGFTDLTGLKLKKTPGYDDVLPFLPHLTPGPKSSKKAGRDKTKLVTLPRKEKGEKQIKRQTNQPNFDAPPYTAQKDLPTIWYSEPKEPLHVKIGQDIQGIVDYFTPGKDSHLFIDQNEVDTGAVRDVRDSAYGAPSSPAYGAPVEPSYGAPVEPSYGAPVEPSYGAPVEPSYGEPVEDTYGAPETSYGVPTYGEEGEDILKTMIYGSEEKLPVLLKVITDYNKVFNFYAGQSAQIAAFYAPGLIPILKKFGFDVKRINWVPELVSKFKPTEEDSYGLPVASYDEPAITYEEPEPSYGAPATSYGEPEPSYGAPVSSYEPAATDPVPVYHSPDDSYAPPSHYAPPAYNEVLQLATSKRHKKDVKKASLDVTPDHHDELLTAVPALELLKLKTKLNRKEAREKLDEAEERASRQVEEIEAEERSSTQEEEVEEEEVEETETEDRTSRLKEILDNIEETEEVPEKEMSEES